MRKIFDINLQNQVKQEAVKECFMADYFLLFQLPSTIIEIFYLSDWLGIYL